MVLGAWRRSPWKKTGGSSEKEITGVRGPEDNSRHDQALALSGHMSWCCTGVSRVLGFLTIGYCKKMYNDVNTSGNNCR